MLSDKQHENAKVVENASVIIKSTAQTQSLWTRQKQTANESEAMTSWDVRTDNNRFTALAHRARARRIIIIASKVLSIVRQCWINENKYKLWFKTSIAIPQSCLVCDLWGLPLVELVRWMDYYETLSLLYNTIQYNKCSSAQSTNYGRLCITMSVNEWDNN